MEILSGRGIKKAERIEKVEKISKLFDDINLREKMGRCSSKYVEEHCSYDVVSKEMELTVTNHREKPIDMLSYKPKNN